MNYCIYSLSDPETMKIVYIGKTKNIKKRYLDHCRKPIGKYKSPLLDQWKKQLINKGLKPIINILEEGNEFNIDDLEKMYIKKYKSNGILNMTEGGDGLQNPSEETRKKIGNKSRGRKMSESTKKKIFDINYNSGKKILCYNINGEFIDEFKNSRRAGEKFKIGYKNISAILNGKNYFAKNYTFFFIDDINIEEKLKKRIDKTFERGRIFLRIDKLGNVKEYNNIMLASSELNLNFRNIWLCLNNKRNRCGEFAWCYKELYDGDFNKIFKNKWATKKIYSTLLDLTFESCVEASKITGIHKSTICNYLKGKKIPKNGDIWKYIES